MSRSMMSARMFNDNPQNPPQVQYPRGGIFHIHFEAVTFFNTFPLDGLSYFVVK